MTWIVQLLGSSGPVAVTTAPSRRQAQDRANKRRSVLRVQTWQVINVAAGETWQCIYAPRKRAKWVRIGENVLNLIVETLSDGTGRFRVVNEATGHVIADALPASTAVRIVEAWGVLRPYEAALAEELKGFAS